MIDNLPGLAVFQGAILREDLGMAMQATTIDDTKRHIAQALVQLDVFLEQAREAVREQNG